MKTRTSFADGGFTLVEVMVVMVIAGLLAAIAIPAFLSQRDKARDAEAKTYVRTAQTAIEIYASEHEGSYSGATTNALQEIEPQLSGVPDADFTVDVLGGDRYELGVGSQTGNAFTISRAADGDTSFGCTEEGAIGCPQGGNWAG